MRAAAWMIGLGELASRSWPRQTWVLMVVYSSGVSGPGLLRMASGMPILPRSCGVEASLSISASSSDRPTLRASRRAYSATRRTWLPVSAERHSMVSAIWKMISFWVSSMPWFKKRLSKASETLVKKSSSRSWSSSSTSLGISK